MNGVWKDIANWLWLLLVPLVISIWNTMTGRVTEVKTVADAALPRKDFDSFLSDVKERRAEDRGRGDQLRADIKQLYERDDAMKALIDDKVEALRRDINDMGTRLLSEIRKGRR